MALKGEEKFRVSDCSLGDWITLGYQASQGIIGSFYDLENNDSTEELYVNRITSDQIHNNSTSTSVVNSSPVYKSSIEPNGIFKAICIKEIGGGGAEGFLL